MADSREQEFYACLVLGDGFLRLWGGYWEFPERLYLAAAAGRIGGPSAVSLSGLRSPAGFHGSGAAAEPGRTARAVSLLRDKDLLALFLGRAADGAGFSRSLFSLRALRKVGGADRRLPVHGRPDRRLLHRSRALHYSGHRRLHRGRDRGGEGPLADPRRH